MTTTATKTYRKTGLTARRFGVELEVLIPSAVGTAGLVAALRETGLAVSGDMGYTHEVTTGWKIVTDASVSSHRSSFTGREVVSPVLSGLDGLAQVSKVAGVLSTLGCIVNRSCGLHVHHDARDMDVKALGTLARLYTRFRPVVDGLMAESRRNNQYAQAWTPSEIEHFEAERARAVRTRSESRSAFLRTAGSWGIVDRYRAVNFAALDRHGTVEFRQHQGTIEADKIIPWILLTQGMVEKARAGSGRKGCLKADGDGLRCLLVASGLVTCRPHGQEVAPEAVELAASACQYWRARAKHFGVIKLAESAQARFQARAAEPPTAPAPPAEGPSA